MTISTFLTWQGCGSSSKMTLVGMAHDLGEKMKIYPQVLTFFTKPKIWERNGQKWKMHVQRVQSYCFCPLKMQVCDVLVVVAFVVAEAP